MEETLLQTQTEETSQPEVVETTEAVVDRPEWLPEKFKDPADMAKAYSELEGKLGKGEEELRSSILKEMEEKAFEGRPETVGDYVLPEMLDEAEAVDNQLLDWWSKYSYDNGLSQDEFAEGIEKYANAVNGQQPDLQAVQKELGDNATVRVEAVQLWMNKFFPDQNMQEAVAQLGSSSAGIKALEHIIEQTKGTNVATPSTVTGQVTQADVEAKMKDPRYWQQGKRDPAFIQEVNGDWQRLHGGR
jgi:hypothetical protein|tara:strand:- start:498 stop:1232 length:735 start_codon:yes stop_codon:yes gene_type:complete